MKIMVVGAINGDFVGLNNLMEETKCDLAITAGNIGMYYYHDKLLPKKQTNNTFYHFLSGKKKLVKPLIGVPGSKENYYLVSKILSGRIAIDNFHLLASGDKTVYHNQLGAIGIVGLGGGYSPRVYNEDVVLSNKYHNLRYFRRGHVQTLIQNAKANILLMHELIGPYIGKNIQFSEDQLSLFSETTASYCFVGRYEKWLHGQFPKQFQFIEFISLPRMELGYGIMSTEDSSFYGTNRIV